MFIFHNVCIPLCLCSTLSEFHRFCVLTGLANIAEITVGLRVGKAEVLRSLMNFLSMDMDRPEQNSNNRNKERGVGKGVVCFVSWLLIVPATCECISGTDLLRQFYVLPH